MVPLMRSWGLQVGEGLCSSLLLGNCQARLEGGWFWLQIQPFAPRAGATGTPLRAGRELCADCGPRKRHVFPFAGLWDHLAVVSAQGCQIVGMGAQERGALGYSSCRHRQRWAGFPQLFRKWLLGRRRVWGQGKGLRGWITRGDSCSLFISNWQRWEGVVFLPAGACPRRVAASAPVLALVVHALKLAACDVAEPHLFFQVSESGVKSSLHTANSPRVFCQAMAQQGLHCLPDAPPAFRGSACVLWGAAAGSPCTPSPTGSFPP